MKKTRQSVVATLFMAAMALSPAMSEAASVVFDGDARLRTQVRDKYRGFKETEESYWSSRLRLQLTINTPGGAYAVGRFRLADGVWDGGGKTLNYGERSNLYVDVGYVGAALGKITLEAGTGYNTMNEFFRGDDPYDFIRVMYREDALTVVAFMEKIDEFDEWPGGDNDPSRSGLIVDDGYASDDDINHYGLNLVEKGKFAGDWTLNGVAFFLHDRQRGRNGFGLDAQLRGRIGLPEWTDGVALIAEVAMKNADYQDSDEAGFGGYVGFQSDFGLWRLAAIVGATGGGFTASGDFGGNGSHGYAPFVMIGEANAERLGMINCGVVLGSATGDSTFINLAPSLRLSDKLMLTVETTYLRADMERGPGDIVELGAIAEYKLIDGATMTALLGYLDLAEAEKNPLGFGLALDLRF
ncbi:MAG: hypothetical protein LBU39_09365 [Desulfobulbaceae bacterium]|jgi:hypothetical protein|nr:hypothetical protein [Desulfobulbaceae bacterium]